MNSLNTSILRKVGKIKIKHKFIDTYIDIENGTEIDNWTFDELYDVVREFQSYYGSPQLASGYSGED